MPQTSPVAGLKEEVREFWNADPCGSRYLGDHADFEAHARARYQLEPYIHEFAGFAQSAGQRVLEVGVGMGADYLEWLKAGAQATGVDLSSISIERAKRRCEMAGLTPDLRVSDAEHLLFPDDTFDVVYSYGVMHHSPDTPQCIREAWRVLKPGGALRIMTNDIILRCLAAASLCVSPFAITWKVQAPSPTREKKRARCCRASSKLSCGKPSAPEICF